MIRKVKLLSITTLLADELVALGPVINADLLAVLGQDSNLASNLRGRSAHKDYNIPRSFCC